jgi:DNA-binding transcriptional regulator YiaG
MKCDACRGKLDSRIGVYQYAESGLANVFLLGVEILSCPRCEDGGSAMIPNIVELHEAIAQDLAIKPQSLKPEEIRFLRTHLGFASGVFARVIGVDPSTVSRWEKGKEAMGLQSERLLRTLILSMAGPFRDYDSLERMASKKAGIPTKIQLKNQNGHWKKKAA